MYVVLQLHLFTYRLSEGCSLVVAILLNFKVECAVRLGFQLHPKLANGMMCTVTRRYV